MTKVQDRHLEERRQQILDAARRVFVQKGYASATMNDIAAEADLSAGSLYNYFPGKSDLIAEVALCCVDDDIALFASTAGQAPSAGGALRELGEEVRVQMQPENAREQATLRLESYLASLRDPALRERVASGLAESVQALGEMIERAQAAGEFDPSVSPQGMALFLHAIGAGLGTLSVPLGNDLDSDAAWGFLTRLLEPLFLTRPRNEA